MAAFGIFLGIERDRKVFQRELNEDDQDQVGDDLVGHGEVPFDISLYFLFLASQYSCYNRTKRAIVGVISVNISCIPNLTASRQPQDENSPCPTFIVPTKPKPIHALLRPRQCKAN
eukprot:1392977-Amorphochlora_amoeboformis.AAC.2